MASHLRNAAVEMEAVATLNYLYTHRSSYGADFVYCGSRGSRSNTKVSRQIFREMALILCIVAVETEDKVKLKFPRYFAREGGPKLSVNFWR
jgi:hypothetical protein